MPAKHKEIAVFAVHSGFLPFPQPFFVFEWKNIAVPLSPFVLFWLKSWVL